MAQGSYATSSGLMGGAQALQEFLVQRKMEAIAQQQAQAKAQQQAFENQVLAAKTQAEAFRNYGEGQKALAPPPKPSPIRLSNVDVNGKPMERFIDPQTLQPIAGADQPLYQKPLEDKPFEAGRMIYDLKTNQPIGTGVPDPHVAGGWLVGDTHYGPTEVSTSTPEAADVKQQRNLSIQTMQGNLSDAANQRTVRQAAVAQAVKDLTGGSPLTFAQLPTQIKDDVLAEMNKQGLSVEGITAQGRARKEVAQTILPKFEELNALAQQVYAAGLQGTVGSRLRQMAGKESFAADLSGLDPQQQKLVGKYLSETGLMMSAIAMAHGGARAGGSIQMLDALKKYLDPGNSSLDVYLGKLAGAENFIGGYASMGEHPVVSDKPPAAPHVGALWQSPKGVVRWNGKVWIGSGD